MLKSAEGVQSFQPPTSKQPAKWTAFFTDVPHEVKPVMKGFRVSLTYNLIAAQRNDIPATKSLSISRLAVETARWVQAQLRIFGENSRKIGFFLKHQYGENCLQPKFLKGVPTADPSRFDTRCHAGADQCLHFGFEQAMLRAESLDESKPSARVDGARHVSPQLVQQR